MQRMGIRFALFHFSSLLFLIPLFGQNVLWFGGQLGHIHKRVRYPITLSCSARLDGAGLAPLMILPQEPRIAAQQGSAERRFQSPLVVGHGNRVFQILPRFLPVALPDMKSRSNVKQFDTVSAVNTQLSKSRLAVVHGYSHYNFITSPELPQIVGKFLADPLTNPPTGATPASQAASDLSKS
jgi:hypothetical protein